MSCISSIASLQQSAVSARCTAAVLTVRAVPEEERPAVLRPVLRISCMSGASVRCASRGAALRSSVSARSVAVRGAGAASLRASGTQSSVGAASALSSARVRQLGVAQVRTGLVAQSALSARAQVSVMEASQICPVHYGVNLLADDGLTRLAWDDGVQIKY